MTRQAKLLSTLNTGAALTSAQIKSQFGIAHPGSAIRNLRAQGNCIYTNVVTNSKGKVLTKYRIGTPSKRMVALAHRLGMFE